MNIYLKGYADGCEAKAGIANWIAFYNGRRLHQALGYRTPMAVWRERMQAAKAVDMMATPTRLPHAHSNSSRQSLWQRDRKGSGAVSFQLTNRFKRSRSAGPFQKGYAARRASRSFAAGKHRRLDVLMYYGWSKEFLEAGKRRLAGETARAGT
jgi:hypothetical protein